MYIEEAPRLRFQSQLSDLSKMYSRLLEQLEGHVPDRVEQHKVEGSPAQ